MGTLALAFVARLLSILFPCVLPLLPIVLGAAANLETVLVDSSPQWLTNLTTRF
jgi:cytochrome c biogenesis protein CcdA